MYLESGLTEATVLFTNVAFEEQVSLCVFPPTFQPTAGSVLVSHTETSRALKSVLNFQKCDENSISYCIVVFWPGIA